MVKGLGFVENPLISRVKCHFANHQNLKMSSFPKDKAKAFDIH